MTSQSERMSAGKRKMIIGSKRKMIIGSMDEMDECVEHFMVFGGRQGGVGVRG